MKKPLIAESKIQLVTFLTVGYAFFIVYASLSPFTGWQKRGLDFLDVLRAPLYLTYTPFDATVNFLAYLPFGLLITFKLRKNYSVGESVVAGCIIGIFLSVTMEFLQMYLPTRISSNVDLLTNSLGVFFGAIIAVSITSWTGIFLRGEYWRHHIFHQGKEVDFGLALLALWMFGQINPSLEMLGNISVGEFVRHPFEVPVAVEFDAWGIFAVILNVMMLGSLMLTILRAQQKILGSLLTVLGIVIIIKLFAAAVLLKSWALLLWMNSEAVWGIVFGLVWIFIIQWTKNVIISVGVFSSLGSFLLVNFAPNSNNTLATKSLYQWQYGHLLTYTGLAQTIAMIFPLLLLLYFWRIR
jgi:VanZ family protein